MEIKSSIVDTSATAKTRWKIAQWFELRWWKRYLSGKNKQAYLQWKKQYWQKILTSISSDVAIAPGAGVCDLGCGPAGIFIALPTNRVTAVDPLIDEYERQLSFFDKADYPYTTFVNSTIEDYKTDTKFEVVFCLNAINHVYHIENGFCKLNELAAANARVVVSIDAHNFSFFKYLFRLIPGDVLHPHQYDLAEYKQFIEKQQLKIVKTELLKKEFFFTHYLLVAAK